MQAIEEIFDKIIYESGEFASGQSRVDTYIDEKIMPLLTDCDISPESIRNEINGAVYLAEKEVFALGFRYGIKLMQESNPQLENVNHS